MKNHKAAGPDEIPMECFKLLDDNNAMVLTNIINQWWESGNFPEEMLKALVASLYKKGDPKKQQNYRPISLLNSIYKIYASALQRRLAEALDPDLQRTQYGFRNSRSTSAATKC